MYTTTYTSALFNFYSDRMKNRHEGEQNFRWNHYRCIGEREWQQKQVRADFKKLIAKNHIYIENPNTFTKVIQADFKIQ